MRQDSNRARYLLVRAVTQLVLAVNPLGSVEFAMTALTCIPKVFALLLWVPLP